MHVCLMSCHECRLYTLIALIWGVSHPRRSVPSCLQPTAAAPQPSSMLLYVAGWTDHLDVSVPCSCCWYCLVLLDKLSRSLVVRCMVLCHSGSIALCAEHVSMERSCPIMADVFKLCMAVCVLQAGLSAFLCRAWAGSVVVPRVGFGMWD